MPLASDSPFKKDVDRLQSPEKSRRLGNTISSNRMSWGVYARGELVKGSKRDIFNCAKGHARNGLDIRASNQPSFSGCMIISLLILGAISVTTVCFLAKKEA